MNVKLNGWVVLAVLGGTMAYAIAADITLTTYYPSPRGVYKELRVGSGTAASPTAKLQVTLPTAETGLAIRVDDEDPNGGDTTPFVIDQAGNVGIGTTNPNAMLVVDGRQSSPTGAGEIRLIGRAVAGLLLSGTEEPNDSRAYISLQNHFTGYRLSVQDRGAVGHVFAIDGPSPGPTDLVIDGGGQVGIGTTSPDRKLHVQGAILTSGTGGADAGIFVSLAGGPFSSVGSFLSRNPEPPYLNWYHHRTGGVPVRYGYIQGGDFGNGVKTFRFAVENGANFTFIGDGNVGIGTDNPRSRLHVADNYIQFPVISGNPNPSACNQAAEAGRVVIRTNGASGQPDDLWICRGASGWLGIGN